MLIYHILSFLSCLILKLCTAAPSPVSLSWVNFNKIKNKNSLIVYPFSFSYSVIVQMVDSQSLEVDKNSSPCRQLSWPQLCGVSRVSGHAAKVRHQTLTALNAFFTSFPFLSCLAAFLYNILWKPSRILSKLPRRITWNPKQYRLLPALSKCILAIFFLPAFLDTGLPRGNSHELDSFRSHARCHPYPIPQPVKVGHPTGVYIPYSFQTVVWVLLRPTRTDRWKCCEMGPMVFRPYPRRLESLSICRCHYKGSTFFSVI